MVGQNPPGLRDILQIFLMNGELRKSKGNCATTSNPNTKLVMANYPRFYVRIFTMGQKLF